MNHFKLIVFTYDLLLSDLMRPGTSPDENMKNGLKCEHQVEKITKKLKN